jgi:hypothetical protein
MALSSTEAEVASTSSCEAIWLYRFLVGCLIKSWTPQSFIVIFIVVSNYMRIQYFILGPST